MNIINFELKTNVVIHVPGCLFTNPTLDEIEDLEINLTDIIKQLQDYRLSQICE